MDRDYDEIKVDESVILQSDDQQSMNTNHNNGNEQQQQKTEEEDPVVDKRLKKKRKKPLFVYMEFESKPPGAARDNLQPFTWRGKLRNFLHSKPCHIAVIALTIIDVILVMTEIVLDLKSAETCSGNGTEEGKHEEPIGALVIHYLSISILSIFMVEIALKLISDWKHFWSHKMEIFDAFVVVIAFACDIAVTFVGTEAFAAVGLLIMLRLWRVVRVINGIILTVKNEGDERVHALKHEIEEKDKKVEKLEKEIEFLKKILHEKGIEVLDEQSNSDDPENQRFTFENTIVAVET